MVTCPTCSESGFDSDRSMRHHHSIVHGENLPNSECTDCGLEFYSSGGERMYCDDCLSYSGQDNPMYDGGKSKTVCNMCESTFLYYESEKPGLYCPDCVKDGGWRHRVDPDKISGEESTIYNSVELNCSFCEEGIVVQESNITEKNFCSKECYGQWRSENQTGEDNPNYKHGNYLSSKYYRGEWSKIRKRAIQRDNKTCQLCGEDGGIIDVHHINPVRSFVDPNDAHTMENVICLCRSCHMKIEHGDGSLKPKDLSSCSM